MYINLIIYQAFMLIFHHTHLSDISTLEWYTCKVLVFRNHATCSADRNHPKFNNWYSRRGEKWAFLVMRLLSKRAFFEFVVSNGREENVVKQHN